MTFPQIKTCLLCIRYGQVAGIVAGADLPGVREEVGEWAVDPTVSKILRVPVEIGRASLFESEKSVLAALEQRRSWVVGEYMLAHAGVSREEAERAVAEVEFA